MSTQRVACPHPDLCGAETHDPTRRAIQECGRRGRARAFTVTDRRHLQQPGLNKVSTAATVAAPSAVIDDDDVLDLLDEAPEPGLSFADLISEDVPESVSIPAPISEPVVAEAEVVTAPEPVQEQVAEEIPAPRAAEPDQDQLVVDQPAEPAPEAHEPPVMHKESAPVEDQVAEEPEVVEAELVEDEDQPTPVDPPTQKQSSSDGKQEQVACENPQICGVKNHIVGTDAQQVCQRISQRLQNEKKEDPRPARARGNMGTRFSRLIGVFSHARKTARRNTFVGLGVGLAASVFLGGGVGVTVAALYFGYQGSKYVWAAYRALNPGPSFWATTGQYLDQEVSRRVERNARRAEEERNREADGSTTQERKYTRRRKTQDADGGVEDLQNKMANAN